MVCQPISTIQGLTDYLVWPTGCFYYFWLVIFGVIFAIVSWLLYHDERNRKLEGDMVSSMGVASIFTFFLSVIASLVKNSDGVPMFQPDLLIIVIAVTIPILIVWHYKDT